MSTPQGIGRAIVEAFESEDCHVGLCARDATAVSATVAVLTQQGITATGCAEEDRSDRFCWTEEYDITFEAEEEAC